MITINSIEEYEKCQELGVNPLFWHSFIKLEFSFRIQLQNQLFGHTTISKKNILRSNDKYYHYCHNHGPLACENCGTSFFKIKNIIDCYSSVHISHILSRGSAPEMAHDPRNHNKLCLKCHNKWESSNKGEMIIYLDNLVVIEELMNDYNS